MCSGSSKKGGPGVGMAPFPCRRQPFKQKLFCIQHVLEGGGGGSVFSHCCFGLSTKKHKENLFTEDLPQSESPDLWQPFNNQEEAGFVLLEQSQLMSA